MLKEMTSSFIKMVNLSPTSKKQLVLLSLSIILATVSIIIINGGDYESSSFTVFAQIENDSNPKMLSHSQSMANINSSINAKNTTTFSSIGTISSLVITVPENEFNLTNAFKVILTGDWVLNVQNGTITNFEANFLASPMDGSRGHIHQIITIVYQLMELLILK
jgi:hypothetical protein